MNTRTRPSVVFWGVVFNVLNLLLSFLNQSLVFSAPHRPIYRKASDDDVICPEGICIRLTNPAPTSLRMLFVTLFSPPSLRESSEGLLSSFCDASSRVSTSLRAARADRRFVKYSLCAGKLHVDPSPAAATSLLEAASAWSTPYGQRSANTCVGARRGGEETQRARSRKSIAQGTVGRNCGYHAREGWGPTRCPCGESAGDRNRESHYKLCRRRHSTTSVGGAARFVGSLAI